MLFEIFKLELIRRLRQSTTWLYLMLFALLSYVMIWSSLEGGGILLRHTRAGTGLLNSNAPFAIHLLLTGMVAFSSLIAVSLFGTAATRDIRDKTRELLFTAPLTRLQYLGGRFLAAFSAWTLIAGAVTLAAFLACLIPPAHPDKLGPVSGLIFFMPLITSIFPFLVRTGLLLFGVALLSGRRSAATMVILVQFISYMTALSLLQTRVIWLAELLDPSGLIAARSVYGPWTVMQKNTLTIGFSRSLILNHVFWGVLALVVFGIAWHRFTFRVTSCRTNTGTGIDAAGQGISSQTINRLPKPKPAKRYPHYPVTLVTKLQQTAHITWSGFIATTRRTPFLTVISAGVLFMLLVGFRNVGLAYDTQTLPVTPQVLDLTQQLFMLFLFIITAWVASELVWHERNHLIHEVIGSTPVAISVLTAGKLGTLFLIQGLMMLLIMLTGITIQLLHGYTHLELSLYIQELFLMRLPVFVQLGVLAFLLHSLARNKLSGHILVSTVYVLQDFVADWGLEHHLWNYAEFLSQPYSAMNGYGPYLGRSLTFSTYWSALALLFSLLIMLTLPRELDMRWSQMYRSTISRLTVSRRCYLFVAILLSLFTSAHAWYQTVAVHGFTPSEKTVQSAVDFEREFKKLETLPHPVATDLFLDIDLFPSQRRVECHGRLNMLTRSNDALVSRVMIDFPDMADMDQITIQPEPDAIEDYPEFNTIIIRYDTPLAEKTKLELTYRLVLQVRGIASSITDLDLHLIENGTFLNNQFLVPKIGYDREQELISASQRKENGLPPRPTFPEPDVSGTEGMIFAPNAGFVNFEAILSTEQDQVALTSGHLVRRWTENNRRYFHYKLPQKALLYFAIVSGRYHCQTTQWNTIPIEVYYHPDHAMNVDTILSTASDTLSYCAEQYHPYPFGVLRLVEYPRYVVTAEAFPGLIPISEGIGFIARKTPGKVDALARLVAHETGHQWFPHITGCANQPGMYFLTETMAQHVALSIMKRQHTPREVNEFLDRQMADYFQMRTRFTEDEAPLAETDFAYHVAYRKGLIAMHAIEAVLGSKRLNGGLRAFFSDHAFATGDYCISHDLIDRLTGECSESEISTIRSLLETVTWYDISVGAMKCGEDKENSNEHHNIIVEGVAFVQTAAGSVEMRPIESCIQYEVRDRTDQVVDSGIICLEDFQTAVALEIPNDHQAPLLISLDPNYYLLDIDRVNNQGLLQ